MTTDTPLPESLPGLDIRAALERIEIPAAVFRTILLTFADKNSRRAQEMLELLERGGLQELAAMGHTLKGAAANIGANQLSDACLAVEMAARQGRPAEEIGCQIGGVDQALDVVLTSLAQLRECP